MSDRLVHDWLEVGDRVFTIRYRFLDQQIGLVLGRGEALVIDTRSTARQAAELLDDVRRITGDPVRVVVDTHWHWDHAFGNRTFRPATIWAHERCAPGLLMHGPRMIAETAEELREEGRGAIADDIEAVEIDLPDRSFATSATLEVGGRAVELRHLGRGHTESDIVVRVPDAAVLFAGDLLEHGAPPWCGDGYPIDWSETLAAMLPLADGVIVPGHGAVADRDFVLAELVKFRSLSDLARRVQAGELDQAAARAASPFGDLDDQTEGLARALAQLRGELD